MKNFQIFFALSLLTHATTLPIEDALRSWKKNVVQKIPQGSHEGVSELLDQASEVLHVARDNGLSQSEMEKLQSDLLNHINEVTKVFLSRSNDPNGTAPSGSLEKLRSDLARLKNRVAQSNSTGPFKLASLDHLWRLALASNMPEPALAAFGQELLEHRRELEQFERLEARTFAMLDARLNKTALSESSVAIARRAMSKDLERRRTELHARLHALHRKVAPNEEEL
eukprot:m.13216 g.13216  ORF g.13216 m.13216 type:complete len:226 (+) comp6144_c0_seq2:17-694(+)